MGPPGDADDVAARAWRAVGPILWLVAFAGAAAWVVLAVVHVGDGYLVDHGAGVRMALAHHAAEGVLFPPPYEDGVTGGTRYLPLPIILHAALAAVTGDLVNAGKLLGFASAIGLAALVVWFLRRWECPWPAAAVLAVGVLVTQPGLGAAFGMRVDGLPAVLQIGAVAVVTVTVGWAGAVAAALLAALAVGSKLTAVWAPLAIAIWLLASDRRRLAPFVGVFVLATGVILITFQVVSEGRMLEQLAALSTAGIAGAGTFLTAPNRLLRALLAEAPVAWALLPLAAFATVLAARRRTWTALHVGLVLQVPLLLITFTDIGVGVNQLIDLAVLTAIVAGASLAPWARSGVPGWVGGVLALAVAYVTATALVVTLAPDVRSAISDGLQPIAPSLAEFVEADATMLSEDPGVPLALGRTPVITDPFMLPRLEELDPGVVTDLVRRIDDHEFDLVVLILPAEGDDEWWGRYHLGDEVIAAIRRSYRPDGRVDGYHLYVPDP